MSKETTLDLAAKVGVVVWFVGAWVAVVAALAFGVCVVFLDLEAIFRSGGLFVAGMLLTMIGGLVVNTLGNGVQ